MGDSFVCQLAKSHQPPVYFRYNPYIASGCCKEYVSTSAQNCGLTSALQDAEDCCAPTMRQPEPALPPYQKQCASLLPPPYPETSRRHPALSPYLQHFAFPARSPTAGRILLAKPNRDLVRLFIGQLPYSFTDDQLNHAISVATGGRIELQHIERIVNWKKNRAPTGCVHAYCMPSEAEVILSAHQRVLFDEEGVWFARTERELAALQDYVHHCHGATAQQKAPGCMPSSLLTVEIARSTYVPDARYSIKQFDGRRAVR